MSQAHRQSNNYGQLGVVWVILSLYWVRSELKRAGGRALSLSSRPPAVKGSLDLRILLFGFMRSDFR